MRSFSQGHKKVFNCLLYTVETPQFQQRIKDLRTKHLIPVLGYEYKKIKYHDHDILPLPPIDWEENIAKTAGNREEIDRRYEEAHKDLSLLAAEYGFLVDEWLDPLEVYFFYNVIQEVEVVHDLFSSYNLCLIRDVPLEKKMRLDCDSESMKESYKQRDEIEDALYPILLRISPNASLRDILDYIKRSYRIIKSSQDRYKNKKIKIGTVRKKNKSVQERNAFIYEHKDLPRKELMKLGMQKFKDFPDHGAVAKIISLENKRREEV